MAKRVAKTDEHKFSALEDHLFLLSRAASDLASGDSAHLRALASQLRNLICWSSGLEGLLWRRVADLNVSDEVQLHHYGNVNRAAPLARSLAFLASPLRPAGHGDPRRPIRSTSLRRAIKENEAVFISGRGLTHEDLIKFVAQESGISHENDGLSRVMAELNAVRLGNAQPYIAVLYMDALLTLEVGERVMQAAAKAGYTRRRASLAPDPRDFARSFSLLTTPFDVPGTHSPMKTGTIHLELDVSGSKWAEPGVVCTSPTVTMGAVTIQVTKTARGRLQIRGQGLPIPYYLAERPMPELRPTKTLAVLVRWGDSKVTVFLDGRPT